MFGVFLGAIPFFLNNLLISHNWLIPAFDLPRPMMDAGSTSAAPLQLQQVLANEAVFNSTDGLNIFGTLSRAGDMITDAMFRGFSFDNIVQGFSGILMFPKNGNIGFLIMCPVILIAFVAFVLWNKKILAGIKSQREIFLFLIFMILAAVFSYLPKLYLMNISEGVVPDMRYLSPAYLPCGIISIWLLSKTPFLKRPKDLIMSGLMGAVIFTPLLILLMIVANPFGSVNAGYFAFFEFIILFEIILCSGLMIVYRFYRNENRLLLKAIPYLLILVIITVFSFQIFLNSIYSMILKFNGYPFWIPLIRDVFSLLINVNYLPPV
jgi:uncharacterized membrane protein